MIKNVILTLSHFFNFRKPRFADLRYADIVIEDKAYFLVSWKIENGYKFNIKALQHRSCHAAGSAYIAIPDGIAQIELVASNLWLSNRRVVKLIVESIPSQTDFYPVKRFEYISPPQRRLALNIPLLRPSAFHILIKNLNKT